MLKQLITLLIITAASISSYAQNAEGMNSFLSERWSDAEKAFSSSSEDIDVYYKGVCQVMNENIDGAKATFNSISTSPYGMIGLGLLELNNNKNAAAEELFKKAEKETKGKNADIFIAIGDAFVASSAEDKSAGPDWAKKAVDKSKNNANYRIHYGNTYLTQLDGGSAITQYEYALQYKPNYPLAYAKIGQTYFRSRNVSLAKENLLKALESDPNNLMALNYAAQLYYRTRDFDSAKMYEEKLIKIGGETPEDMAMMANIYFLGKDYDQAITLINKVIEGDNKYNYLNRLIGYSYFETGKPQEAVSFLTKFLGEQPQDKIKATDYEYLAKSQLAIDPNSTEANDNFMKAIEMDPKNRDLIESVAKSLKSSKKYAEAIPFYEKLTQLEDATHNDFNNLGAMQFRAKEYEAALASYNKALEINPSTINSYYLRALTKKYADPSQEIYSAKDDYLKVLELTQGQEAKYQSYINKANLYLAKDALKNNDDTAAQSYIDSILAVDPTNAKALDLMKYLGTGGSVQTDDDDSAE